MAVLIVASEGFELEPFAARLTALRKLPWPLDYAREGLWEGRRAVLVAHGAGPGLAAHAVRVAQRAMEGPQSSALEAVVSAGLCGGLAPQIVPLQVVVGAVLLRFESLERTERVVEVASLSPVTADPPALAGPLLSCDRIIATVAEKTRLAATGALAVEMEALGVQPLLVQPPIPFHCIKVVSDDASEALPFDLNQARAHDGRIDRGKIRRFVVMHPGAVPGLFRLNRRAKQAAEVLGDFLARCQLQFRNPERAEPGPDQPAADAQFG